MVEWSLLTIGWCSRNRFWGEPDDVRRRDTLCTCTVLRDGPLRILVDPSVDALQLGQLLDAHCGLKPADIDQIYITHGHRDHCCGIDGFPGIPIYAPPQEVEAVQRFCRGHMVQAGFDFLTRDIRIVPLPGHTNGLMGLLFPTCDGTVAIAGDAVMNREFFLHRLGYYNSVDGKQACDSIEWLALHADFVIPGHGNYFSTKRKEVFQ